MREIIGMTHPPADTFIQSAGYSKLKPVSSFHQTANQTEYK